jgi:hypothetical protein
MDTHNEFMTLNNYYIWFLIDTCDFEIDEIEVLYTFEKHLAFSDFVNEFMTKRLIPKNNGDNAAADFFMNYTNGSYGYDIMNEEIFTKAEILDSNKTFVHQLNPNFVPTKKLKDNQYQVQLLPRKFRCETSISQGFFTLDNAKFWYLNFIYNFMYNYKKGFKYVINDEKFYNENVYKFFPSDFYSSKRN